MISLNLDKYPELKNIDEKNRDKVIQEIFDIGYKIIYDVNYKPIDNISENLFLKNILTTLINNKIDTQSSYKKGEIGEVDLETSIKNYFPHYIYKVTRNVSNSGDAHIYLPTGDIIMLESKYYNTLVSQKEIDKMKNDMKKTNINKGIFISHTSNIANIDNKQMFDIIEFIHDNKVYTIYCIPNYNNNIIKLQCVFQLITYNIKFTNNKIYCNSLKILLSEFSEIINQHQKIIEDDIDIFNKSIKSLSSIMSNYKNTVNNLLILIETKTKDYSNKEKIINNIIKKYNNYYNINNIFNELGDLLIQYECMLVEMDQHKYAILNNKNIFIANIKILKTKIIIIFKNNDDDKYEFDNKKIDLSIIQKELDELITK
jgi:hypothetical protein